MAAQTNTNSSGFGTVAESSLRGLIDSTIEVFRQVDAKNIDGSPINGIEKPTKAERVWLNIIAFGYLYLAAIYGAWLMIKSAKWQTIAFALFLYVISGLGITAGVHRLWAHRSYEAKWPLRFLLMIFNTVASKNAVFYWARDHRIHHKYLKTEPATRRFFFPHISWLLGKEQPEVRAKDKAIDLSDLRADPIIMFQKKYYYLLMPLVCLIIPTLIPMYCWHESFMNSWFVATMFRWCFVLNIAWLENSHVHKYSGKSYDRHTNPVGNSTTAFSAFGEGWHHHAFPWDYKTAEFGDCSLNLTTAFINFFAKIGWAYELKSVSPHIILERILRTRDVTHFIWGWGDKDQPKEEVDHAIMTHKKDE